MRGIAVILMLLTTTGIVSCQHTRGQRPNIYWEQYRATPTGRLSPLKDYDIYPEEKRICLDKEDYFKLRRWAK